MPALVAPEAPWVLDDPHRSGIVSVLVVVMYVMVCATGSPVPVVVSGRMETVLPITRSGGTFDFSLITYVTLLPSYRVMVSVLPAS